MIDKKVADVVVEAKAAGRKIVVVAIS